MTSRNFESTRVSIADLEMYGLSMRQINALEGFGILYVDQLLFWTEDELRNMKKGVKGNTFSDCGIENLRESLRNLMYCHPVKTLKQCMSF